MPLNFLRQLGRRVLRAGKPSVSGAAPKVAPSRPARPKQIPAPVASVAKHHPAKRRRDPPKSQPQPPAVAAEKAAPWSPDDFQVAPREGQLRFQDLDLPVEILHAVADLGFEYCTPVQAEALPHALAGKNVAGRAQTGTGKTAAFLIAILTTFLKRQPDKRGRGRPRALIIAPTRELVLQIAKDAGDLGKHCPFHCVAVYGGMDLDKQRRDLERGSVDLIAATPGRLLDFMDRKVVDLSQVEFLVIDEADRMLDMGFIPDVRRIINRCLPRERRQSMLFSATLTDDVRRLAAQWVPDPVVVEIEPDQVAVDTVDQIVYAVSSREKFTVLYNILRQPDATRVLIFGNRRDRTQKVADNLTRHGVHCELLSGAVAQKKRFRILEDFRAGQVKVLVATDVAGRGIHVDSISHVVNYDFPYEADDYVHRIGRTGRAGAAGTAISFACEDESFIIPDIEAYIGRSLPCKLPDEALLVPPPPVPRDRRRAKTGHETDERVARPRRGGGERSRGSRPRSSSRRPSR